jgi:branched-chain amino acid transport system substrate-binding protein
MGMPGTPYLLKGAELAVEEINAKGGVSVAEVKRPLKLEVMDTRDLEPGVPVSEALLVVEKLILDKKVDLLVGGPVRTEAALAAMDLMSRHKKVSLISEGVFSPSYAKRVAENYDKFKYCFKATADANQLVKEAVAILEKVRKEHGLERVYIMAQDVKHARGAVDSVKAMLEKKGWIIVGYDLFPTGSTNFSVGLLDAKQKKAQILFLWFDMAQSSILIKQWHDLKIPALPLGYINSILEPQFWDASKTTCAYSASLFSKAGNIATEAILPSVKFVNAYKQKYGGEPKGEWPSPGYTAIYILADAIGRVGTIDSDAIVAALEKTNMMGTYGRIRFDPRSHDIIYSDDPEEGAVGCWVQWQVGKRVIVFPPKLATASIKLPPWMR